MKWPRWLGGIAAASAVAGVCGCLFDAGRPDDVALHQVALGSGSASFQDGLTPTSAYAGTRDTMIDEDSPSSTHGGDTSLSVDGGGEEKTVLVSWDLAGQLPAGAVIQSATITLMISDKSDDAFTLHEARRPWSESQATWQRAASGDDWQSNGADGAEDRGAAPLGVVLADATGARVIPLNAAGIALVQQWVNDPASNHGFVLAGHPADNRLELRSSEYATKTSRPKLSLTWDITGPDAGPGDGGDAGPGPLDPTPGNYKGTCDGSAAVALDGQYFLDANDENQGLRVYRRGANAAPVQTFDVSSGIGMSTSDEADIEGAARVGDRVYWVTSHGRNKEGDLLPERYRFFAVDLAGAPPNLSLTVAGSTDHLLPDLLDPGSWATPNAAVISLLQSASQLSNSSVPSLAPELNGTSIEGLAALPTAAYPGQLVLGLRNPQSGGKALLVTLRNADAAIGGATAHFGEAIQLDLDGLGVRALAWSSVHQALLLLGGPKGSGGPFRLYKWSGDAASAPIPVQDVTPPADSSAEAVVTYPSSTDVQVIFDQGDALIGGDTCKKASSSNKVFRDVIVHVD